MSSRALVVVRLLDGTQYFVNDREIAMAMMLSTVKDEGNEKKRVDAMPMNPKCGKKDATKKEVETMTFNEVATTKEAEKNTFDEDT
eukprot:1235095-Heterocapsa_arctica.AAC.1